MRVVHLSSFGGPYPASFIPMLRAVSDAAAERGWSFEAVFTEVATERPWFASLKDDGFSVRIAPTESRKQLTAWLNQLIAERDEPTVFHTHFTAFDISAALVARRREDVTTVWHVHSRLQPGAGQALRNVAKLSLAGRWVDAILCVSEDTALGVRRRMAPADRVVVFPNAIDLRRFLPAATPQEREQARSEFAVPADAALLVHLGWDWERKGGDMFLAAIEILSRSGTAVAGLCVGGGDRARATCARLGLDEIVQVVEPRDDVRTFYAAADLLVSPSRAEGMPYAVLEALCTGTPAVISNIPSHVPLAEEISGCTLADRNPQAFAAAIGAALRLRDEGGAPVDIGELPQRLDLDRWSHRLIDLYAELAQGGRGVENGPVS